MTETEKFEDIVEDSLLKNFGRYVVPKYTEKKTDGKWFQYSNVVEFVIKRNTAE